MPPHLLHSHAHEEIPGTVDLNVREGDDAIKGEALFPVPSADPNDPLLWPQRKKNMVLFIVSFYSFLGNWAIIGPATYILQWSADFGVDPGTASNLISYSNLAFGFCSIILVPMYLKVGRRPTILLSQVIFCVFLVVAATAKSFKVMMVARVLHSFGSGVCEALPTQVVNDVFFISERAAKLGYYTVALCFGATAPLFSGYMLNAGLGSSTFFWVTAGAAVFNMILTFFFFEETMFERKKAPAVSDTSSLDEKMQSEHVENRIESNTVLPARKTFAQQIALWSYVSDVDIKPFLWRPFTYLAVPACLWVILVYGIQIGIGAFGFNYTFPILIQSPPYNWTALNSGLLAISTLVAYAIAGPISFLGDVVPNYLTKRNGGIREAEMRLPFLIVPCLVGPAGMLLYGMACQYRLHWFSFFAAAFMCQISAFFFFTISLAYAMDSYQANLSEMLVIMNLGKQGISFAMSIKLLDWIQLYSYKVLLGGVFTACLLFVNILIVPLYFFGKDIRRATARGPLARLHKRSILVEGETH